MIVGHHYSLLDEKASGMLLFLRRRKDPIDLAVRGMKDHTQIR